MHEEAYLITVKLLSYFLFFGCFLGNLGDVGFGGLYKEAMGSLVFAFPRPVGFDDS